MSARSRRAARLRGYFDLQLRFAARLAELGDRPLGDWVTTHTNLHRRLGLGDIRNAREGSPLWRQFLHGLAQQSGHEQRLAWTVSCFERAGDEPPPPGEHRFGCFACDASGPGGEVRLHFTNQDQDGISPLAPAKAARRRAELAALFGFVRRHCPHASSVRGTSWLYHLDAYRRLFPPDYVASRRRPESPVHFHGSSSWGQFLDHGERLKPGPAARFLANLESLDPDDPQRAFPLAPLRVTAPVVLFYNHFGV